MQSNGEGAKVKLARVVLWSRHHPARDLVRGQSLKEETRGAESPIKSTVLTSNEHNDEIYVKFVYSKVRRAHVWTFSSQSVITLAETEVKVGDLHRVWVNTDSPRFGSCAFSSGVLISIFSANATLLPQRKERLKTYPRDTKFMRRYILEFAEMSFQVLLSRCINFSSVTLGW